MLLPPPRDGNGDVVPHDHEGIRVDDGIIRRISEQQIIVDEKIGDHHRRISSMAFKCSSGSNGGMSVDLQREIEAAGLDPRSFVTTQRWIGAVRFLAGDLRAEQFQVGFDPLSINPYHGQVWGSFTRARQNQLRQICTWFVEINGVLI